MIGLSVRPGRDRLIQPRNDFVAPERLFNEVQQ